ncbi:MAG: TetR/AcrR family transcriptional regulator [Pseudomonadota bacterium]|nr:TetR/AcrR family transcriptional regulator [Pseudomonadota bacterium]
MTKPAKKLPRTGTPVDRTRSEARVVRKRAVSDVRRSLVLAAARSAFLELGLEGASLREIAKRAGYTPGAIYSYFSSKEEVYGALLGESLERLNAVVSAAQPEPVEGVGALARTRTSRSVLRVKATAFFDFYRESPRDLDLGFYLFRGMQPRGLTPVLNEQLNARLRNALAPAQCALVALGMSADDAQIEVTALFAHIAGLLLLSHTGRIRMFRQESQALFERYLDDLMARAASVSLSPSAAKARATAR